MRYGRRARTSIVPKPISVMRSIYSCNGSEPLKHKARSFSSSRKFSGMVCSQVGSLITKRPCFFKVRYISVNAVFRSSSRKILNKQFCAAISILLSSTGKLNASPFLNSINSRLNHGFSFSASIKFSSQA